MIMQGGYVTGCYREYGDDGESWDNRLQLIDTHRRSQ